VRERPPYVHDADVLAEVARAWDDAVGRVEYLPVGFGAHHWAAYDVRGPRLFVTYDELDGPDAHATLDSAYAGAGALRDAGLDFVLAPLVNTHGRVTAAFAAGALSCTPWRDGASGGPLDLAWTRRALARLHALPPPPDIPRWQPVVSPDFADTTETLCREPWGPGPYADAARAAVRRQRGDLDGWVGRYHALAAAAQERPWVPAHGEPHSENQLLTSAGRLLVDWDTLRLAPAELDLRVLVDAGADVDADPEMVELFDLEWRLDEISQYVAWFAAPHGGTGDDEIAFGGLQQELTRPTGPRP
jgi:spectinomycin phosphotransferase